MLAAILLFCSVVAETATDSVVANLVKRSFFPLTQPQVTSLFPSTERSHVRTLPYEQPEGLTYLRWEPDDKRCYAEFSPQPDLESPSRIERIQFGCLHPTRNQAIEAAKRWANMIDANVAGRLHLRSDGDYYSVHKLNVAKGRQFSLEIRVQNDGTQWGADIVLLDHYPPAYVH